MHAGTESKDGGRKTVISLGGALPSLSCLSLHPLITPSVSISVPSSVSIPASLHFFSSLHFYTLFSSTCFVYLLALIPPFALWMFPVFLHSGGEEEGDMKKKNTQSDTFSCSGASVRPVTLSEGSFCRIGGSQVNISRARLCVGQQSKSSSS